MHDDKPIDVRWGLLTAVVVGAFGALASESIAWEAIGAAGLLVVASGAALALDYRNAIDRWLEAIVVTPRMHPRRFAKITGAWLGVIGLAWCAGSLAMLL